MKKYHIKAISYASTMDSLKDAMLCARLDICFVVGIMSGY